MMRSIGAAKAAFATVVAAAATAAILAAMSLPAFTPGALALGSATSRSALLTLSPAPGDLAVAMLRFPAAARRPLGPRTLHVAFAGPHGGDYLAVAVVAHPPHGGARALVLLVNRPSALLDPAHVRLRARWSTSFGGLSARSSTDALSRSAAPHAPALCGLTRSGKALPASALRALSRSGAALGFFTPAAAVADAYDAACGLAYPLAFRQAVQGTPVVCGKGETKSGGLCCPPGAMCVPGPEPVPSPAPEPSPEGPPGEPPRCPPCNPRPGTACPLVAQPSSCPAVSPSSPKRLAAPGAH